MRITKAIRFLNYLGPRLFIHSVMEKLRGRTFRFYNEERIQDDNLDFGYNAKATKKSHIHDLKPIPPEDHRVSIIIPSDNLKNITLCVEKIFENTTYPNYEIVVVTNSEVARLLETKGDCGSEAAMTSNHEPAMTKVKLCPYDKPYNFSDKCNEGALAASGNILCFYNDDVYPIDKNWLHRMLNALNLPKVGGVTPLQMSNQNSVLSAGNVLGSPGFQTFAFSHIPYTPPRNLKSNQCIIRDVSALSGACLLIKKSIFEEVGMFNATNTPNSFSDTEISLKIREKGYRCIIIPTTRMLHENKTSWRKTDKPDKAFQYMMEKWGKYLTQDVFFTDYMKVIYEIGSPPHIYKYHAPEKTIPRKPGSRDILFVSNDLNRTGAPTVLMDMVKVVIDNGDWPVVISMVDGPLRQEYLDMGVTVIIDNSICDMTEPSAFKFNYVARNFDLVVVNTLACWRTIEVLSDSLPPVLWWIHESPFNINTHKDSLPKKLAANTRAYAVSEYCANALKNASISYNLGELTCGMSDYSTNDNQKTNEEKMLFLIIGSIEYIKGQDIFINAVEQLDKNMMNKAEFAIIGSPNDIETMAICKSAAARHENLTIYESMPRDELRTWYQKANCLIIPSREETLSMVGLEALMLSVPIISSDNVGLVGHITHTENGLVFQNENSTELSERIAYAIENRNKMADMGRNARKEIYEKHFTMEKFKENALLAVEEVLTSGNDG